MVQFEGFVASAIEDEDDDEGRGRFWTNVVLFQLNLCMLLYENIQGNATIGNLDTRLRAVEKSIAWR
jgi:hypothetical protein